MDVSSGSDQPYLLGIDFGTESCRAGLFDSAGRLVAAEVTAYGLEHPRPGWAE
jgi:sugar (pentulose or hexulose) kinase